MPLAVEGMANLQRALKTADRDVRLGIRREMRETAEPVRRDAQIFAGARIRNMRPPWDAMRTGVTQKLVYVAPRKRGVKKGDPAARPNLSALVLTRAMQPALDRNQQAVRAAFGEMLDTMAAKFNRS